MCLPVIIYILFRTTAKSTLFRLSLHIPDNGITEQAGAAILISGCTGECSVQMATGPPAVLIEVGVVSSVLHANSGVVTRLSYNISLPERFQFDILQQFYYVILTVM
jgi:hypothetical protein